MDDIDIGVPYLSDVQVSSTVLRRLQLIAPRTREWDNNPAAMSKEEREELASTFSRFEDFAIIGMKFLGFDTTWMQLDIAKFMADITQPLWGQAYQALKSELNVDANTIEDC